MQHVRGNLNAFECANIDDLKIKVSAFIQEDSKKEFYIF